MRPWEISEYLENVNGHLHMDKIDVVELASEHSTPLFVFSEKRIGDNVHSVIEAFRRYHTKTNIHYASKACSNLAILDVIKKGGCSVEVNSLGELFKAIIGGFRPEQIILNGVAKTRKELLYAIRLGIKSINIDSIFELEKIVKLCSRIKQKANIAIRIVPGTRTDSHPGFVTGTHESKFGMLPQKIPAAIKMATSHSELISVVGIHMHIGSQTTALEQFRTGTKVLVSHALEIEEQLGKRLEHVNLGGGIPINYVKGQAPSELPEYLRATINEHDIAETVVPIVKDKMGSDIEIVVEPGRRIVGDVAALITTVQNIKIRGGTAWLALDAGFNTLLDASNFKWYFHAIVANKSDKEHVSPFRLAGPLCDSGDVFFDIDGEATMNTLLKKIPDLQKYRREIQSLIVRLPRHRLFPKSTKPDDVIAFLDVGAYTLEQMSQYNGRQRSGVVMITTDRTVERIRRRDSMLDLLINDLMWA